MIRERCDIDNELILNFLKNNQIDFSIQKNLLDWYALLGEKDFKQNRDKAIEFIKGIAEDVLLQIEFSKEDKDKLIGVFEPLETILRTAQSLNVKSNVRDHLSHTIRVILFTNYLFHEYFKITKDETKVKREIFIAAIFHDMAYPIEKIKDIGTNLSEGTFKDLLNSKGKIDFNLNKPNDLLELMDFWGTLPQKLAKEFDNAIKSTSNSEKKKTLGEQKDRISKKIIHIYKEIFTPAIAGQGLFNAKHNLSSVVLFLRPILKEWKDSPVYLNKKIESICDICLAIAYHDRSMPISNFYKKEYETEIPQVVKMLRMADELQEWDRTRKDESYTDSVTLDKSSEVFSLVLKQKDTKKRDCNPIYFVPDKIEGLISIIKTNPLYVEFKLPTEKTLNEYYEEPKSDLSEKDLPQDFKEQFEYLLKNNYTIEESNIDCNKPIKYIALLFNDNKVTITFDSAGNINCKLKDVDIEYFNTHKSTKNDSPDSHLFFQELEKFRLDLCNALKEKNDCFEPFEPIIEKIIKDDISRIFDTDPLIILKNRQQLGLLRRVKPEWKNVDHTRYDHSIGVAAKCIVVCDYLNSITSEKELKFSTQDVKELALAAALHDCGHLPMSHAVERAFLSSKFKKSDVSHEARIIPLLLRPNPYFETIHKLTDSWVKDSKDFDSDSLYRVAAIISQEKTETYIKDKIDFQYPKRAILQLLTSEIDLDRLDFIIRDAAALNYSPVVLIEKDLLKYIGGLTLVKANTLRKGFENDVELCVNRIDLQFVFFFLVSRVLLYKYCYFSKKVRSFEAILTYLISDYLDKNIEINPLKLIPMSDDDFIEKYLESLLQYISDKDVKSHILTKYINVLKKDKVERFKFHNSIDTFSIKNPRLAKELEENLNKYSYINTIKNTIREEGSKKNCIIEKEDLLLDVFSIKAGGGDLLVSEKQVNKITGEKKEVLKILKDFMNGSNIHRLCTETRLDIYFKSDIGESKKEKIDELIKQYYEYAEQ